MTAGAASYDFVCEWLSALPSSASVLEVGCGAQQYRPHVRGTYTGLDLPDSPYLHGRRPDVAASAEAMPVPPETFDVVFGVASFYWMEDVNRAFAECSRVLRPDGRLMVFDYQRAVCAREAAQPQTRARHVWDYRDIRGRLLANGFQHVDDRTDLASRRRLPPVLRQVRRRLRNDDSWLIVEGSLQRPSRRWGGARPPGLASQ
ncbi:MAG: class I SAM-dependent methyltransferase [Solirubrobacteraceae bacterium]